jgi:hypothetical protein
MTVRDQVKSTNIEICIYKSNNRPNIEHQAGCKQKRKSKLQGTPNAHKLAVCKN